MARPVWTGVLTFGLVALPVALYSATEDHTVHFHQLQRGTSDRVRNKRVNERTGKEVDYEDIVKGYEISPGEYVVIEPEELEEMSPTRSKTIEVSGFVDLADVEPIFFDRTYYLGPSESAYGKIYKLIAEALEHANRAGIALFTMRGKEYLTAVRAHEGLLELQTMRFADEIRDPRKEIKTLPTAKTKVTAEERETAEQLIGMLATEWKPEQYHDTVAEQVRQLVKDKAAGNEIVVSAGPPAEATNVVDLLDALKRSVADARAGRAAPEPRRPTRRRKQEKKPSGPARQPQKRGTRTSRADLSRLTKAELYERATKLDIPGRSTMKREELEKAVSKAAAAS